MELLLFLVPLLVWVGICKLYLHIDYSWGEAAIQLAVTSIIIIFIFSLGNISQTSDMKFVNGVVEKVDANTQSCPLGWRSMRDSHCTEYTTRQVYSHQTCSGTGSSRSCTKHYDTEYKYIYGWETRYYVNADIRNYEISRVDRQGAEVPPRFAQIKVGDPVTAQVAFTNYIRGASDSLFSREPAGEDVPIAYPSVRDYYIANRVLVQGIEFDSDMWKVWNHDVMRLNTSISETGANAIIVVTGSKEDFAEMLARAWEAHNINDVVTVIGLDGGNEIKWVDVASWSNNSTVEIEIRDRILELGTLDKDKINEIIQYSILTNFELKDMKEFEYLADDIPAPTWAYILAALILLILTPTTTYLFNKHKVI